MFLACFRNHQYLRRKAVAASHVTPTQRVIVMSRIRPANRHAKSPHVTPLFHLYYFILDVLTVSTYEIK